MRKPRILRDGYSYHVTALVNRQEHILDSAIIKALFMQVLRKTKRKYRFIIQNFCIMGNHVHFIIKPYGGESLSRIMQFMLSIFASRYNKRFNLKGHVWYDRFKSRVIESFRQYFNTFLYISNNPVKAGLVKHASDYPYCGIAYIHKGISGIMERPPNELLKMLWVELNCRKIPDC